MANQRLIHDTLAKLSSWIASRTCSRSSLPCTLEHTTLGPKIQHIHKCTFSSFQVSESLQIQNYNFLHSATVMCSRRSGKCSDGKSGSAPLGATHTAAAQCLEKQGSCKMYYIFGQRSTCYAAWKQGCQSPDSKCMIGAWMNKFSVRVSDFCVFLLSIFLLGSNRRGEH